MTQITVQQAFGLAQQHQQAGRLGEAESLYRRILQSQPDHVQAIYYLGVIAHQQDRNEAAIELFHRAVALSPGYSDPYSGLGNALSALGRLEEAADAHRKAIALDPHFADAYNNLGNVLRRQDHMEEGIAVYQQAIALRPGYAHAYNNLAIAFMQQGRLDEAIVACRKAAEMWPDSSEVYLVLGNLGNILGEKGRLSEALAVYRLAISYRPDLSEAYNALANVYRDQRRLDDAIATYRQSIALRASYVEAHDNLLLCLNNSPAHSAAAIAEEHRAWDRLHAQPLAKQIPPYHNDRNPDLRLRIGYISPDLREHAVAKFLLPLFTNHDKSRVEIFAYAHVPTPDPTTQRLRSFVDTWHSIVEMTDEKVAELIRRDQIDILVDLAGHTSNNRLLVLARKPAPIQVTYLGYPNTTGMTSIDYRITDELSDPPGETESFHSEQLVRLPQCMWCYGPQADAPPVSPLPALASGKVTFGTFNQSPKLTDDVLRLWAAVLRGAPSSRLLLKNNASNCPEVCRGILNLLAAEGIAEDRIQFVVRVPTEAQHMDLYKEMDIALDPFPYNGTTTTCEALWMGLPVVTLAGRTHVSRVGVSLLNAVGLPELVASSPGRYVQIAIELASDLPRLRELRFTLRQRMRQSPLMDGPRLAREVEAAYRKMWETWCKAG